MIDKKDGDLGDIRSFRRSYKVNGRTPLTTSFTRLRAGHERHRRNPRGIVRRFPGRKPRRRHRRCPGGRSEGVVLGILEGDSEGSNEGTGDFV